MARTVFSGRMQILNAFLNSIFTHAHDGVDGDGHAPIIVSPLKTVNAAYAVNRDLDCEVRADASAAAFAVTLPAGNTVTAGRKFVVHKKDATVNAVTVLPTGADTVDGFVSIALTLPGDRAVLMWDGVSNWIETGFTDAVGVPKPFCGNTAPYGYLQIYGQAVSRTAYARLFGVIGITYGAGNGVSTFNIPDGRGRTLIGLDNMGGTPANVVTLPGASVLGGKDGSQTQTLSSAEVAPHLHPSIQATNGGPGPSNTLQANGTSITGNATGQINVNADGGSPHNNMQPFIAVNYMIKY